MTVFAPSDAALSKLPGSLYSDLLRPANRDRLQLMCRYHVVPGKWPIEKLRQQSFLKTVSGQLLHIEVADGNLTVDGAKVVRSDLEGSDGFVHVIEGAALPNWEKAIVTMKQDGRYTMFLRAIEESKMSLVLDLDWKCTVLAPTDEAFATLDAKVRSELFDGKHTAALESLVEAHVVAGLLSLQEIESRTTIESLGKQTYEVRVDLGPPKTVTVGGARITSPNVNALNAVIHSIDRLLWSAESRP